MKKIKKAIAYLSASLILFAVSFSLVGAQSFGISASGNGWGFSIGSGSGSSGGGWNPGFLGGAGLPAGSIMGIISNILLWLLGIFGFIGVIGFVISGIMYLTAAGDDTKMESAKKAMTYSIIGVVVGLSGVVLIQAIDWALSGSSTTF